MQPIKILFILPSFHTGGSERVILHLLNNLDRKKFHIRLIALKREGPLIEIIPKDISVVFFNHHRTITAIWTLYKEIRNYKPELVFSTLNQVNLLISILIPFLPGPRFISRESSIISKENGNSRYPKLFRFLYKTTYCRYNLVICQSEAMHDDLLKHAKIDKNKVVIINNPVDFRLIRPAQARRNKEILTFITVGQLRREKGHDRIIKLLSRCSVPFQYQVIGDGPMIGELRELARVLNLADSVHFLGSIPGPYQQLADADLFIQGSYYEGFPNAVIEAMASGVPVVAFTAPGGHNEIILQGTNGWVGDESALADIINNMKFLELEKADIVKTARDRYELKTIIARYEDHLIKLAIDSK